MKKYYAEYEIDKYLIENYFLDKKDGIMLETGAGMPEIISMSKAFRELGWRTICVEPNPAFVQMHKDCKNEIYQYALGKENADDVDFEIYHLEGDQMDGLSLSSLQRRYHIRKERKEIIKTTVRTVDWLFETLKIEHIDLASIDVEGWELEVLAGFNLEKYQPKIVVLEYISDDLHPTSDAYNNYMHDHGYNKETDLTNNYIYKNENY